MDLSGCGLRDSDAIVLAQLLKKNTTLTSIDLSKNGISSAGTAALTQALERNTTLISMDLFKFDFTNLSDANIQKVLECNIGIRDLLERRVVDVEREGTILQLIHDQTPECLSKYYLSVLLEADYTDQSLDKTASFLKKLDRLLQYNLQNLPERFKINLMEVIERKLLILSRAITKASLWEPKEEDHLITYLSYISILRTARKESYGDLSMLIRHCLRLKGLVFDEGDSRVFDSSLSFTEWLSAMNGLEADHQVKAAMYEILVKIARYQMRHSMDENNVLAAFTGFNRVQEIKQQTQRQVGSYLLHNDGKITDKDHQIVTSVNCRRSRIGKNGAIALARTLEKNSTLTSMDLYSNEIGEEGVIVLAEALKLNRTLTSINLSSNSISHQGAMALTQALEKNTSLTSMDLGENRIGDEGARALAWCA